MMPSKRSRQEMTEKVGVQVKKTCITKDWRKGWRHSSAKGAAAHCLGTPQANKTVGHSTPNDW